jgi:hypothetical protein
VIVKKPLSKFCRFTFVHIRYSRVRVS